MHGICSHQTVWPESRDQRFIPLAGWRCHRFSGFEVQTGCDPPAGTAPRLFWARNMISMRPGGLRSVWSISPTTLALQVFKATQVAPNDQNSLG
jgi:hypothetical protein